MDRPLVYPGQNPLETDNLRLSQYAMVGLAKTCEAVLGIAQAVAGFTLTPTAPASLSAVLGPGQVFQQAQLEATPFSTLPADGHTVVKQGILFDAQTLTFTPPAAAGYAQNFLVEVQYQDADAGATVLPYYNAANPQVGFSGPGGAGTAQNTVRRGAVAYQIKAGVAATAGTQTSPAPDAGWAGLYVVTLAQGATTITAGNITLYAGAPFIPVTLPGVPRGVQSGQWEFGVASGTNAYTVALSPAPLVRPQGMEILVYIPPGQVNTLAATLNDGLGIAPFVRQGGGALAPGDVSGFVPIVFDSTSWRVNGFVTSDILALITANAPQITPNNPTLYVDINGSDTNNGSSSSQAFRTAVAALSYGVSRFSLGGKTLTIQLVSAGTYTAPPSIPSSIGALVIQGNASNPNGYILSGPGSSGAVIGVSGVSVTFRGVTIYNTSSTGNGIAMQTGGAVTLDACSHGAANNNTAGSLVVAFSGGSVNIVNASNIQTDCSSVLTGAGGTINVSGAAFNVTKAGGGTIAVTTGFATAYQCGTVSAGSTSFMGAGATGPKYSVSGNGVVNVNGGGANYWPGTTAGTTATGGQYLP